MSGFSSSSRAALLMLAVHSISVAQATPVRFAVEAPGLPAVHTTGRLTLWKSGTRQEYCGSPFVLVAQTPVIDLEPGSYEVTVDIAARTRCTHRVTIAANDGSTQRFKLTVARKPGVLLTGTAVDSDGDRLRAGTPLSLAVCSKTSLFGEPSVAFHDVVCDGRGEWACAVTRADWIGAVPRRRGGGAVIADAIVGYADCAKGDRKRFGEIGVDAAPIELHARGWVGANAVIQAQVEGGKWTWPIAREPNRDLRLLGVPHQQTQSLYWLMPNNMRVPLLPAASGGLALPRLVRVVGRIQLPSTLPMLGRRSAAPRLRLGSYRGYLAADGSFAIDDVPEGEHRLSVSHRLWGSERLGVVDVRSNRPDVSDIGWINTSWREATWSGAPGEVLLSASLLPADPGNPHAHVRFRAGHWSIRIPWARKRGDWKLSLTTSNGVATVPIDELTELLPSPCRVDLGPSAALIDRADLQSWVEFEDEDARWTCGSMARPTDRSVRLMAGRWTAVLVLRKSTHGGMSRVELGSVKVSGNGRPVVLRPSATWAKAVERAVRTLDQ